MSMSADPKYRKDIDGLRALAVILVVIFHTFPAVLPGGFVGVDIFFVISGFLITRVILENLHLNNFSFADFYSRRICRIFPALIIVFIFSLTLGWFILLPDEYRLLGSHTLASAGFLQNINLLSEVGYFDEQAENKPLLHLWSLGIEEQFYLIWPVILWLAYKLRANLVHIVCVIGASSFLWNLMNVGVNQAYTFFSPSTRFWELLIGAALTILTLKSNPLQRYKHISILGLCLIAIGVLAITSKSLFPGWLALFPTMGAFFIIGASENDFVNRHLLANKLMVSIGLISYPLYLWHWVLLAFLRITESGDVNPLLSFISIILAIFLSILTYRFVEKPIRSNRFRTKKTIGLFILMILIGFVGYNFYKRDGLAFRSSGLINPNTIFVNKHEEAEAKRQEELIDGFDCKVYDMNCEARNIGYKKILVWGDSHAQMLTYGLKSHLPAGWQFFSITAPGCSPKIIQASQEVYDDCSKLNRFALDQIKKLKPDIVLLGQRDAWDQSKVDSMFAELRNDGAHKILYLGKSPEWTASLPKIVTRKMWHTTPRYSKSGLNLETLQLDFVAKDNFKSNPLKHYISLIDLLCNSDGCLVYMGEDVTKGITSFDAHHLSPMASEYIAKELIIKHLD